MVKIYRTLVTAIQLSTATVGACVVPVVAVGNYSTVQRSGNSTTVFGANSLPQWLQLAVGLEETFVCTGAGDPGSESLNRSHAPTTRCARTAA